MLSCGLTVALFGDDFRPIREARGEALANLLRVVFNPLVGLVHVFDVPFKNKKIGC